MQLQELLDEKRAGMEEGSSEQQVNWDQEDEEDN